jgi:hypothetical protein
MKPVSDQAHAQRQVRRHARCAPFTTSVGSMRPSKKSRALRTNATAMRSALSMSGRRYAATGSPGRIARAGGRRAAVRRRTRPARRRPPCPVSSAARSARLLDDTAAGRVDDHKAVPGGGKLLRSDQGLSPPGTLTETISAQARPSARSDTGVAGASDHAFCGRKGSKARIETPNPAIILAMCRPMRP